MLEVSFWHNIRYIFLSIGIFRGKGAKIEVATRAATILFLQETCSDLLYQVQKENESKSAIQNYKSLLSCDTMHIDLLIGM